MPKAVFVALGVLALSACAGVPSTTGRSKTATPGVDTDVVKVVSVERWAGDKGATVVWIHYPTKSRDDSSPLTR